AQSHGDEDGIVFGDEVVKGNVLADGSTRVDGDAQLLDHAHFGEADFHRLAEDHDSVCVESACHRLLLEDGDVITELGQLTGTGKTCWSRTYDGNFVTVGLSLLEKLQVAVCSIVHGISLQASDGDWLFVVMLQ